jgi:tetratricopeptide (TPR) repeat protein
MALMIMSRRQEGSDLHFPQSNRSALDRANVLLPDVRADRRRWARANVEFRRTSELAVLRKTLAELSNESTTATPEWLKAARYETAMLERDYATAARLPLEVTPEGLEEVSLPTGRLAHSKAFHQALLAVASGADAAARQQALEVAQTELEAILSPAATPMDASKALAELAVIHAFLGRKAEAIREAERSVALQGGLPGSVEKNACSASLALVYAQTGESEKAIALIEHLLTVPVELEDGVVYNLTLTDLKWRWVWDPLRSHPRFQKILAGPEPKTVY